MTVIPWELVIPAVIGAALLMAWRVPGSRRWIAALASLAIFGFAAFVVLLIGSFTQWGRGGTPPLPYVIGSVALLLVGLALGVWVAFLRDRRPDGHDPRP